MIVCQATGMACPSTVHCGLRGCSQHWRESYPYLRPPVRLAPMPPTSGFEPDTMPADCRSSAHAPPSHIDVPPGQRYRHVCATCGTVTLVRCSGVTL